MATVLIVDDSAFVLRHHTELAQQIGLTAYSANNGETAIELFYKYHPHIVICDIMMPEMDGYEVLQALKEIEPNIFLYFISADVSPIVIEKAIQMGAKGVIMKPSQPHTIAKIVQEYEDQKK